MTNGEPFIYCETVLAKPEGIWTLIQPFVKGPVLLQIEASDDRWGYAPNRGAFCGADGDASALIARDHCLEKTSAVGALIGKIGGSSASPSDYGVFVVGRYCAVVVTDEGGPLYLTINDTVDGMSNNVGVMHVRITRHPAPPQHSHPNPGLKESNRADKR